MVEEFSLSSLNPFADINMGGSLGTLGTILLVIAIAVVIIGLIGVLFYWFGIKKKYWITIEVSRLIGGQPMRVATYSAREVAFGMAGDKLWRVVPEGMIKLKTIKWLPVGKIQSAPRVWKYWIREDGEWINYQDANLDELSKQMGAKFVQEDMRLQRLATERLLEQRLMNKTFWEKWGTTVMMIIVFLVVAVCMVVIFYQFSKLLDKMGSIIATQDATTKVIIKYCGQGAFNTTSLDGGQGLIPA
jgi:hypothetical protein